MKIEKNRMNIACVLLRIGVGSVFLLFGIAKILEPGDWVNFMPSGLTQWVHQSSGISVFRFLWIQGGFECLVGLQVLAGFLTKISAFICSLILLGIISSLGLEDPIAVRDITILFASLSILIMGGGRWSVDQLLRSWEKDKK